jgi:hypothetical protein
VDWGRDEAGAGCLVFIGVYLLAGQTLALLASMGIRALSKTRLGHHGLLLCWSFIIFALSFLFCELLFSRNTVAKLISYPRP